MLETYVLLTVSSCLEIIKGISEASENRENLMWEMFKPSIIVLRTCIFTHFITVTHKAIYYMSRLWAIRHWKVLCMLICFGCKNLDWWYIDASGVEFVVVAVTVVIVNVAVRGGAVVLARKYTRTRTLTKCLIACLYFVSFVICVEHNVYSVKRACWNQSSKTVLFGLQMTFRDRAEKKEPSASSFKIQQMALMWKKLHNKVFFSNKRKTVEHRRPQNTEIMLKLWTREHITERLIRFCLFCKHGNN